MTNQALLVQLAVTDPEFDPKDWVLHEQREFIVTAGFMPPVGNIYYFYVTVPGQDGDFDLEPTYFGQGLDELVEDGKVGGWNVLPVALELGETFSFWSSEDVGLD